MLEYLLEAQAFLLHLLVVASALVCSPSSQVTTHHLEDLLRSAQVLPLKVGVVILKEQKVFPVLVFVPVA